MRPYHLVISCEHAGNVIPKAYQYLFVGATDALSSHRGLDIGAMRLAETISEGLRAKLFSHNISRLLVDCNRSKGTHDVFSEYTKQLKSPIKNYLFEHYYDPYRRKVEDHIKAKIALKPVLHLSVHTFTPIWDGKERGVDIGMLFDEQRYSENAFCTKWEGLLQALLPNNQIDLNKPYKGTDDGFTSYLRTRFNADQYLGIEIELNQKYATASSLSKFSDAIIDSVTTMMTEQKYKTLLR